MSTGGGGGGERKNWDEIVMEWVKEAGRRGKEADGEVFDSHCWVKPDGPRFNERGPDGANLPTGEEFKYVSYNFTHLFYIFLFFLS